MLVEHTLDRSEGMDARAAGRASSEAAEARSALPAASAVPASPTVAPAA
jgi:hypothetical protein